MKTDDSELKVFISARESTCSEMLAKTSDHTHGLSIPGQGRALPHLRDLDHLAFLPPGDAALTGGQGRTPVIPRLS